MSNEQQTEALVSEEWGTGVKHIGSAAALVAAGLVEPGWLDGLAGHRRQIARQANGGWEIVGSGKGNRLTNAHKEAGAFSVGRRLDGRLELFAYFPPAVARERKAAAQARYQEERAAREEVERTAGEQATWLRAKAVHQGDAAANALRNYSHAIAARVHELQDLIVGQAYFEGFPRIGYPSEATRAKAMLGELAARLKQASPKILDRQRDTNVFRLDGSAYAGIKERA